MSNDMLKKMTGPRPERMTTCCVKDCKIGKNSKLVYGTSLHVFPRDVSQFNKWVEVARVDTYSPRYHPLKLRICSLHFKPEDFKADKGNGGRNRVRENAIPKVFPWTDDWFPPYLDPSLMVPRKRKEKEKPQPETRRAEAPVKGVPTLVKKAQYVVIKDANQSPTVACVAKSPVSAESVPAKKQPVPIQQVNRFTGESKLHSKFNAIDPRHVYPNPYLLEWPGLERIPCYIIDTVQKKVYSEMSPVPRQQRYLLTSEHKYVTLESVLSQYNEPACDRADEILEELSSYFSEKGLWVDHMKGRVYVHISLLMTLIMVYPIAASLAEVKATVMVFLNEFRFQICSLCGFENQDCQCCYENNKPSMMDRYLDFDTGPTEATCHIKTYYSQSVQCNIGTLAKKNTGAGFPSLGQSVFPVEKCDASCKNTSKSPGFPPSVCNSSSAQAQSTNGFARDNKWRPLTYREMCKFTWKKLEAHKRQRNRLKALNDGVGKDGAESKIVKKKLRKGEIGNENIMDTSSIENLEAKENIEPSANFKDLPKLDNLEDSNVQTNMGESVKVFANSADKLTELKKHDNCLPSLSGMEGIENQDAVKEITLNRGGIERGNAEIDSDADGDLNEGDLVIDENRLSCSNSKDGALSSTKASNFDAPIELFDDGFEDSELPLPQLHGKVPDKALQGSYALLEYMPTQDYMIKCLVTNCGQCFDTIQMASLHIKLHLDKDLKCYKCDLITSSSQWYDLLRHIGEVHQIRILENKLVCHFCGLHFTSKENLHLHYQYHFCNRYRCIYCSVALYTWEQVCQHMKTCKVTRSPFTNCPYCNLTFKTQQIAYTHIASHVDGGLVCPICPLSGNSERSEWFELKVHLESKHANCPTLSRNPIALSPDLPSHAQTLANSCFKGMADPAAVTSFVKSAKMMRQHSLKAQSKLVAKPTSRQANSDGEFPCTKCGKCFRAASHLSAHEKLAHKIKNKCHLCNFIGKSDIHLRMHKAARHKDQTLSCNECGRKFTSYVILRSHLAKHARKTKYPCMKCRLCFSQPGQLQEHMKLQHRIGPIDTMKCAFCDYKCTARNILKLHLRKAHPEQWEEQQDSSYHNSARNRNRGQLLKKGHLKTKVGLPNHDLPSSPKIVSAPFIKNAKTIGSETESDSEAELNASFSKMKHLGKGGKDWISCSPDSYYSRKKPKLRQEDPYEEYKPTKEEQIFLKMRSRRRGRSISDLNDVPAIPLAPPPAPKAKKEKATIRTLLPQQHKKHKRSRAATVRAPMYSYIRSQVDMRPPVRHSFSSWETEILLGGSTKRPTIPAANTPKAKRAKGNRYEDFFTSRCSSIHQVIQAQHNYDAHWLEALPPGPVVPKPIEAYRLDHAYIRAQLEPVPSSPDYANASPLKPSSLVGSSDNSVSPQKKPSHSGMWNSFSDVHPETALADVLPDMTTLVTDEAIEKLISDIDPGEFLDDTGLMQQSPVKQVSSNCGSDLSSGLFSPPKHTDVEARNSSVVHKHIPATDARKSKPLLLPQGIPDVGKTGKASVISDQEIMKQVVNENCDVDVE